MVDKFTYHISEYRQIRQYADMGVKLPASTLNNWIHAAASKLYPLYEALGEDIRGRGYLQIDEVPWRIADTPGKCRKGYAWQFFDATPDSHGLYFYYLKDSLQASSPGHSSRTIGVPYRPTAMECTTILNNKAV